MRARAHTPRTHAPTRPSAREPTHPCLCAVSCYPTHAHPLPTPAHTLAPVTRITPAPANPPRAPSYCTYRVLFEEKIPIEKTTKKPYFRHNFATFRRSNRILDAVLSRFHGVDCTYRQRMHCPYATALPGPITPLTIEVGVESEPGNGDHHTEPLVQPRGWGLGRKPSLTCSHYPASR